MQPVTAACEQRMSSVPCSWEPQPNGTPGLMALHLRAMDAIHAVAPGTVYLIEVDIASPLWAAAALLICCADAVSRVTYAQHSHVCAIHRAHYHQDVCC